MNKLLVVILGLILSVRVSAQDVEFGYEKTKNNVYLNSDKITYGFDRYVANLDGSQTRTIQSQDGAYRLLVKGSQQSQIKKVLNSKDSLLATVFLTGDKANSMLLANGKIVQHKKVSNGKWAYTYQGKEVVSYVVKKNDGRKRVTIQHHDPSFNLEAIEILCLEHATQKLKGNPAAMLFVVSGLSVVILTVASEQ